MSVSALLVGGYLRQRGLRSPGASPGGELRRQRKQVVAIAADAAVTASSKCDAERRPTAERPGHAANTAAATAASVFQPGTNCCRRHHHPAAVAVNAAAATTSIAIPTTIAATRIDPAVANVACACHVTAAAA